MDGTSHFGERWSDPTVRLRGQGQTAHFGARTGAPVDCLLHFRHPRLTTGHGPRGRDCDAERGRGLAAAVRLVQTAGVLVGLGHVDLVCRDLPASLAFYRAVFGPLGLEEPFLVDGERGEQIHYLRFPAAGSGSLGLRQALEEQPFELYAPGLHHLAFAVEAAATSTPPMRRLSQRAPRSCTPRDSSRSTATTTTRPSFSTRTGFDSRSPPPATRARRSRDQIRACGCFGAATALESVDRDQSRISPRRRALSPRDHLHGRVVARARRGARGRRAPAVRGERGARLLRLSARP